jgi:hypothetical protein
MHLVDMILNTTVVGPGLLNIRRIRQNAKCVMTSMNMYGQRSVGFLDTGVCAWRTIVCNS